MTTENLLPGLQLIKPKVFNDNRGYFYESYQQIRYKELDLPEFVQDNVSRSHKNVIRGLHYQLPSAQAKLVFVTRGEVWDVIVDIRINSPTFGKWCAITLSDTNHFQLYIPTGFAHGFCVVSDIADFHYKCTDFYAPQSSHGIIWNDKDLNIPWPVKNPILSAADEKYSRLSEIAHDKLFV